jgi:hypothetical protein
MNWKDAKGMDAKQRDMLIWVAVAAIAVALTVGFFAILAAIMV